MDRGYIAEFVDPQEPTRLRLPKGVTLRWFGSDERAPAAFYEFSKAASEAREWFPLACEFDSPLLPFGPRAGTQACLKLCPPRAPQPRVTTTSTCCDCSRQGR